MENVKKNPILRILISAIVFSLISGIIVAIIGFILGWKTSTQFSDGFFWAGAILISLGFVSAIGRVNQGTISEKRYIQSADHQDMAERSKQLTADITKGNNILAFLGTSGLLLCVISGVALLVGKLF
jgi:hypothetical protein